MRLFFSINGHRKCDYSQGGGGFIPDIQAGDSLPTRLKTRIPSKPPGFPSEDPEVEKGKVTAPRIHSLVHRPPSQIGTLRVRSEQFPGLLWC